MKKRDGRCASKFIFKKARWRMWNEASVTVHWMFSTQLIIPPVWWISPMFSHCKNTTVMSKSSLIQDIRALIRLKHQKFNRSDQDSPLDCGRNTLVLRSKTWLLYYSPVLTVVTDLEGQSLHRSYYRVISKVRKRVKRHECFETIKCWESKSKLFGQV